jgi:thioredoxin 1
VFLLLKMLHTLYKVLPNKDRHMITRRLIALTTFLPLFAGITSLNAAEKSFFDTKDFTEAKKAGKRILIEVGAPWCPTCRTQKPILEKLGNAPENKNMIIFYLDFDTQKEELRALNARSQSTLIAFKGEKETARSVGDTKEETIATLVASNK